MSTTTTPTTAGATFRVARDAAGVSVRSVAARASISHSSVSLWERDRRELADDTVDRLKRALADLMRGAA